MIGFVQRFGRGWFNNVEPTFGIFEWDQFVIPFRQNAAESSTFASSSRKVVLSTPAMEKNVIRGDSIITAVPVWVTAYNLNLSIRRPTLITIWRQVEGSTEGLAAQALGAAPVSSGDSTVRITADDLRHLVSAAGDGVGCVEKLACGVDVKNLSNIRETIPALKLLQHKVAA